MSDRIQTDYRQNVLQFIKDYCMENGGISPTIREIAAGTYSHPNTVSRALDILEVRGEITRFRGRARSVRPALPIRICGETYTSDELLSRIKSQIRAMRERVRDESFKSTEVPIYAPKEIWDVYATLEPDQQARLMTVILAANGY